MASGSILDALSVCLAGTELNVSRERGAIVVRHEYVSTRIEVVPHEDSDSPIGPINSVVQIRTDLPDELARMILSVKTGGLAAMNRMASLGALMSDGHGVFVGSRLTIFESEHAERIHVPLTTMAIIGATPSILRGASEALSGNTARSAECAWQEKDFEQVAGMMSDSCACTTGATGFTAEFGLRPGAVSALSGDYNSTALWSMHGDEPHPVLGAGLFCLLQMPQRFSDETRLAEVLAQLNRLEMLPHALPPHFGAWCEGKLGHNPSYVSFIPNALHDAAPGIAANVTVWASARAQWANATLASMGITINPPESQKQRGGMFRLFKR